MSQVAVRQVAVLPRHCRVRLPRAERGTLVCKYVEAEPKANDEVEGRPVVAKHVLVVKEAHWLRVYARALLGAPLAIVVLRFARGGSKIGDMKVAQHVGTGGQGLLRQHRVLREMAADGDVVIASTLVLTLDV